MISRRKADFWENIIERMKEDKKIEGKSEEKENEK